MGRHIYILGGFVIVITALPKVGFYVGVDSSSSRPRAGWKQMVCSDMRMVVIENTPATRHPRSASYKKTKDLVYSVCNSKVA